MPKDRTEQNRLGVRKRVEAGRKPEAMDIPEMSPD